MALEDLHWGDKRSLDFVYALARRLQDRPALLLFSYRLSEADRLGSLLARLNRDRLAGELVLGPLEPGGIDLMVQAIFGVSQPVRRDVVSLLYRLTGGNTFFIDEVLKGWVSAGSVSRTAGGLDWAPPGHLAVPRNVHEAVRQHLPRLDNELRTLLSLAAVAGQRFNLATICELSGRDAATVLTGLDGLAAAQLVVEVSPGNFAFRHPLTRDAVYSGLRPSELRTLHRRMVDVLAKAGPRSPEGRVGELAYHCYAGGLWEKALEFSARAAERASALYAPQEAAEHLNRAVLAAHQLGIFPPPGILRARGKARQTLGHAAEAGATTRPPFRLPVRTKIGWPSGRPSSTWESCGPPATSRWRAHTLARPWRSSGNRRTQHFWPRVSTPSESATLKPVIRGRPLASMRRPWHGSKPSVTKPESPGR